MRFTASAEKALSRSDETAAEYGCPFTGSEHLLIALLSDNECAAYKLLKARGVTFKSVTSMLPLNMQRSVCADGSTGRSARLEHIIEYSYELAVRHGGYEAGTEHLLLASVSENECTASKIIAAHGVRLSDIFSDVSSVIGFRGAVKKKKDNSGGYLERYGTDLCELSRAGKLDPCIGRLHELSEILRILCRKNKNNPCLTGDAGVGKTAVVEGLAGLISQGRVPAQLRGKTVISVDISSIVAGTRYRGDFEERFRNLISEAGSRGDVILFFDEIHTISGAGAAEGAIDASNILKQPLGRGELTVIGATTDKEYEEFIEKDPALSRRFSRVIIPEPDGELTFEMIRGLRPRLQEHHGVIIEDKAIVKAIDVSEKYVKNRFLPDKAIDLIDEASSYVCCLEGREKTVTENDVMSVCRDKYGLPRFDGLEQYLCKHIFGHDEQIKTFVGTLVRRSSGFRTGSGPFAAFIFRGPPGVGKRSVCRFAAEYLYSDKRSFVYIDMKEYPDNISASHLTGHGGKPGLIASAVRSSYGTLLCIDNIDAAPDSFLSVMEHMINEGRITDAVLGKTDLSRTVIVLISEEKQNRAGFLTPDCEKRPHFFFPADLVLEFSTPDKNSAGCIVRSCVEKLSVSSGIKLTCTDEACRLLAEKAGPGATAKDLYEAVTDTLSRQLCGTGVSAAEIGSDGNNIVITSLKALDKSRQAEYN